MSERKEAIDKLSNEIKGEIQALRLRIAELEAEVERLRVELTDWETVASHAADEMCDHPDMIHCSCVPLLRRQLARKDEALRFYANRDNYYGCGDWKVPKDEGIVARAALTERDDG